MDKLVEDVNDPIYQMQKEAFTIQKEALSNFRVIGKGVCVTVFVYVCMRGCTCACVCMSVCLSVHLCMCI